MRKTQVQHLDHPQGREALFLKKVNRASRIPNENVRLAHTITIQAKTELLMWPRKLGTFILQFPATHKESLELSICIRYGCSRASGRARKKSRQKKRTKRAGKMSWRQSWRQSWQSQQQSWRINELFRRLASKQTILQDYECKSKSFPALYS